MNVSNNNNDSRLTDLITRYSAQREPVKTPETEQTQTEKEHSDLLKQVTLEKISELSFKVGLLNRLKTKLNIKIKTDSLKLLGNLLKKVEDRLNAVQAISLDKIMSFTSTINMLSTQIQLVEENQKNNLDEFINEFEKIIIEDFSERFVVLENTELDGVKAKHCITMTDRLGNLYLYPHKSVIRSEDKLPDKINYPAAAVSEKDYFAKLVTYAGEKFTLKSSFFKEYLNNLELNMPSETIAQLNDEQAVIYRDVEKDLPRTDRLIINGEVVLDIASKTMPDCIKGLDRSAEKEEVAKRLVEHFAKLTDKNLNHTMEVLKIATQASSAKNNAVMVSRFGYTGYRFSTTIEGAKQNFIAEARPMIVLYNELKEKLDALEQKKIKFVEERLENCQVEISEEEEELANQIEATKKLKDEAEKELMATQNHHLEERTFLPWNHLRIIDIDTSEKGKTKINVQSVYKIQNVFEQVTTDNFCKTSMYFVADSNELEARKLSDRMTHVTESYSPFYDTAQKAEEAQPHLNSKENTVKNMIIEKLTGMFWKKL